MNSIWYKAPAQKWEEAFAVGNGRLGAMVWGNVDHEIIDINEESLWSKPYSNRNNKNAKEALKNVRALLKLKRNSEAQECMYESFSAHPEESAYYKSAGRVHIDFYDEESYGLKNSDGIRKVSGETVFYKRELDLETSIATTSFTKETVIPSREDLSRNTTGSSITYNREVFVSEQEDVIAVHIWASTPKSIFLRASLQNDAASKKYSCGDDTIALQSFDGIPFAMLLNASSSNGKVSVTENSVIVEAADEVTLFIDVETAFAKRSFAKKSYKIFKNAKLAQWCYDRALRRLCFAANISYLSIKKQHVNENMALYSKINFSLAKDKADDSSETPEASVLLQNTDSPEFAELYYNYSRYLLLSSCGERSKLPPLKNGIFMNPDDEAKHLRYDFNDVYENKLLGSLCTAKKLDAYLFNFLRRVYKNGKQTAFQMFGIAGSAAFNATDIWADTAPCGTDLSNSYNPLGLAILAVRIVEYYESTLDKKFLRKNIGIIKSACEFFEHYLVLQNEKTQAVLIPAGVEDEQNLVAEGNLKAEAVIADLFRAALKAYSYAGFLSSEEFVVKAKNMLLKLPATNADESYSEKFSLNEKSFMGSNFKNLSIMTKRIISSELNENVLTVRVLPKADGSISTGSIKNLSLKGNLYVNLEWKNGSIESGNLFTKSSGKFIENVVIVYQGKEFPVRLMNGQINLMNVLPTTVK